MVIGPSGSGKANYLLNSIQRDNNIVDKIYLYAKDLGKPKFKLVIDKREKAGINKIITNREKGKYLLFLMI